MREGCNLGQVGRLSDKIKEPAGIEEIDFVGARIHEVDFLF